MSRFSELPVRVKVLEGWEMWSGFHNDTFDKKANLSFGAYQTDESKPWVLPVVRTAEKDIANDETLDKEYMHMFGLEAFTTAATKLALGPDSEALLEKRAFGVQGLSGTGSIRIGADFLRRKMGYSTVYCSNPTWDNHETIFEYSGYQNIRHYRYWSDGMRGFDFESMLEDLSNAPENSVIVLHACAHNPTGCDPTREQWEQIADVMEERKLFPFFDFAYQGFASGDFDKDAWPWALRYFVSRGFELFSAQSFAKNFGLYNERIGNLCIVLKNANVIPQVRSQMEIIIRTMYSTPPTHGARVVAYILNNADLFDQWKEQVKKMANRIINMRKSLKAALEKLKTPGNWDHIITQIGMFSYTGLNEAQSNHMIKKYHLYMLRSGRISMAGVTTKNVEYIAKAIHETLRDVK